MTHRIVVIEDDPHVRGMLGLLLEALGYTPTMTENVAAGTAAVAAVLPYAVLCDVHLRHEDGLALAESLRVEYPDLRIVIMTGVTTMSDVGPRVAAIGATLLHKPFEPAELVAAIERGREFDFG
jgi:DNA-binding response OmpR family regulator